MTTKKVIYLIGSLRNQNIPTQAAKLREYGFEVFDDWWSASEDADEWWQRHERFKGSTFLEAFNSYHAKHVFEFDYTHLNRADIGVLILPAGKSGHIEYGYMCGTGKPCYVLFDAEPERYDVMYRFGKGVFFNIDTLGKQLQQEHLIK